MALVVNLREHGRTLSTRPLGAQILASVSDRWTQDEPVILEFADVLAVSYSFADEFAGRLAEMAGNADSIELLNARPEVTRVVERAIQRRLDRPVGAR